MCIISTIDDVLLHLMQRSVIKSETFISLLVKRSFKRACIPTNSRLSKDPVSILFVLRKREKMKSLIDSFCVESHIIKLSVLSGEIAFIWTKSFKNLETDAEFTSIIGSMILLICSTSEFGSGFLNVSQIFMIKSKRGCESFGGSSAF